MGNIVHMRDFAHDYEYLRRHALRGDTHEVWGELLVTALWLLAYCIMCVDLWLFSL